MAELFGSLGWKPISERLQPAQAQLYAAATSRSMAAAGAIPDASALVDGSVDPQQFTLLQLTDKGLRDLHDVTPTCKGSNEVPDVQLRIQLISLHLGLDDREATAGKQASLRLDIGKDSRSSSQLDPLLWSVAAGVDLTSMLSSGAAPAKSARVDADLSTGFRHRPIEIPNGLAQLRIEIVAHPEPPAWRRVFSFMSGSNQTQQLISVLGFPGITLQAAKLLDQIMGAVDMARAQVLFRSRPLTIALNDFGADDFRAGLPNVSVATVNDGYVIMARFADIHRLLDVHDEIEFRGGDGLLVRKGGGPLGSEFDALTYAVLRVRAKPFRISALV